MLLKDEDKIQRTQNGKRICIDLDGVIHKYSKGYDDGTLYDIPTPGAIDFINNLKEQGYTVYIFTARLLDFKDFNLALKQIESWLEKYKVPYDHITCLKVPADAYIDDRAVHFDGDWKKAQKDLNKILKDRFSENNGLDWGYYHHKEVI